MSDNVLEQKGTGKTLPRAAMAEMMMRNFERLPDLDQKLFKYGPVYLAGNGALAGLIANSLFRRSLNITQGLFASSLPMAILPFLTTFALYSATVSKPLLDGDLNCPSCSLMRGALVGVLGAGLYPIILAIPVNAGLATRYNTAPMPDIANAFRFMVDLSKPVLRKMRAVVVLQAFFGTYLGSRHFETYVKLVELTRSSKEELHD